MIENRCGFSDLKLRFFVLRRFCFAETLAAATPSSPTSRTSRGTETRRTAKGGGRSTTPTGVFPRTTFSRIINVCFPHIFIRPQKVMKINKIILPRRLCFSHLDVSGASSTHHCESRILLNLQHGRNAKPSVTRTFSQIFTLIKNTYIFLHFRKNLCPDRCVHRNKHQQQQQVARSPSPPPNNNRRRRSSSSPRRRDSRGDDNYSPRKKNGHSAPAAGRNRGGGGNNSSNRRYSDVSTIDLDREGGGNSR